MNRVGEEWRTEDADRHMVVGAAQCECKEVRASVMLKIKESDQGKEEAKKGGKGMR